MICRNAAEDVAQAETLSLHVPSVESAKPLLGPAELSLLPRGTVLVNTGRGSLVDDDALLAALATGQITTSGLDFFSSEPNYDKRFLEFPQVFVTRHAGSATAQTRNDLGLRALTNIGTVLGGRPCGDGINATKGQ